MTEKSDKVNYIQTDFDSMAKHRKFTIKDPLGKEINFKVKKDETTSYDIWVQNKSKKIEIL